MSQLDILDVPDKVISVDRRVGVAFRAILYAPEIASRAKPMQFINVRVQESLDPLLRRPFSLSDVNPHVGTIEITWMVVGRGTKMMTQWKPNQTVHVLGPLGNGVGPDFLENKRKLILLAGGTGFAPIQLLGVRAREKGVDTILIYGAKSRHLLMNTDRLKEVGCKICTCTEDGSYGSKGLVTDMAELQLELIAEEKIDPENLVALGCGPTPMLAAIENLFADTNIPLYISLESKMACGYGLCQGCAVRAVDPQRGYYRVCTDGPVFLAKDVELESE